MIIYRVKYEKLFYTVNRGSFRATTRELKEARKDKLKRNRIKRLVDGTSSPKHIEKMKNPKMNWRIARFTIRQHTYGDHLEQGSLTIYHVLFRLIIKRKVGTCVSS